MKAATLKLTQLLLAVATAATVTITYQWSDGRGGCG